MCDNLLLAGMDLCHAGLGKQHEHPLSKRLDKTSYAEGVKVGLRLVGSEQHVNQAGRMDEKMGLSLLLS